jgi:hypothetical protein
MPVRHVVNKYLTDVESPEIEQVRRATYRGQAAWAIGPQTCGDCKFWDDLGLSQRRRERRCRKYFQMMDAKGPPVPGTAPACRYFKGGTKK